MDRLTEIRRIKEAYHRRDKRYGREGGNIYQLLKKYHPNLFRLFMVEHYTLNALVNEGFTNLAEKKIVDIGCGGGTFLRNLLKYGATPEKLYGVDLLEDRIRIAKRLSPNINFWCGDACQIPYKEFDLVVQSTVFTSIKSHEMKTALARKMLRILKPGGMIFWYDYHMNNPQNRDVQGVKKKEIYQLFYDCDIKIRRVTLAPPVTRILAPFSYTLCLFLEHFPFLCTHYFAVIRPNS